MCVAPSTAPTLRRPTGEGRAVSSQGGSRTVTVLRSNVDTSSETYISNQKGLLELIAEHDEQLAIARAGGGERYNARHKARGKLLPRERIELLLDRDAPFLELSPIACWGTQFQVGGSIITGIGVVSGVECVIICHEAT